MAKRPPVPRKIQTALLVGNRHACCVCQKNRVQIHHIDGNPANNDLSNLAALCLDHHNNASMVLGLTKKLQPEQILQYKQTWEEKCTKDIAALSRDRLNFYATLYKNPPRIREAFLSLLEPQRKRAVKELAALIAQEDADKSADGGFQWQMTPKNDGPRTNACLSSAYKGEIWPQWLPRVAGHPEDADYPMDRSPPNGMEVFHTYDLYCQILVQLLCLCSPSTPFEEVCRFTKQDDLDSFVGNLVHFRDRIYGKGVKSPRESNNHPTSSIQIRSRRGKILYRATMQLKNMYVFSDTSAENLKNIRACGVGILASADRVEGSQEIKLVIIPLLIGIGGLGQSAPGGFGWKLK